MSSIRVWHTYLGLLIAPSVLFFSVTGALQLFGLHEASAGYEPPMIIEQLGRVHKDQVFAASEHHNQQAEPAAGPRREAPRSATDKEPEGATSQRLLKCYFLVVALGLVSSTILGLWMGLTHIRHKRVGRLLLAVGALAPLALILFDVMIACRSDYPETSHQHPLDSALIRQPYVVGHPIGAQQMPGKLHDDVVRVHPCVVVIALESL
jgi:hypothetical protein